MYSGSGGKQAPDAVARAAQARRRQRVHQHTKTSSPPESAAADHAHQTPPPSNTTTLGDDNDDDVMNRSMEVGEEVASLLASVRKSVKSSTQKHQHEQPPSESSKKVEGSDRNRSSGTTRITFQDDHQQQQQQQQYPSQSLSSQKYYADAEPKEAAAVNTAMGTGAKATMMSTSRAATATTERKQPSTTAPVAKENVVATTSSSKKNVAGGHRPKQQPLKSALKQPSSYHNNHRRSTGSSTTATTPPPPPPATFVYDAACFTDGSRVLVQSHTRPTQTVNVANSDLHHRASLSGSLLGCSREILRVSAVQVGSKISADDYLRFGDRVTLQVTNSTGHSEEEEEPLFLGVQRESTYVVHDDDDQQQQDQQQQHHHFFDVGFYPRSRGGGTSQQWVLFSAAASPAIKVGHAALEEDLQQAGTGVVRKKQPPQPPIRSGDGIVLRNCLTGGILTSRPRSAISPSAAAAEDDDHHYLQLLTDAYRQPVVADPISEDEDVAYHHPDQDPSLLTRLQRSDRLVPSASEVFYFRPRSMPPTPLWISASGENVWTTTTVECDSSINNNRRSYLDGTYLWFPVRNEGDDTQDDGILTAEGGAEWSAQMKQPDGQELALLDELIGASMGLEGRYIKAVTDGRVTSSLRFHLFDDKDVRFDTLLRRVVEEMLPLPTAFAHVRRFVNLHTPGYEYGSVMQALCHTLDGLLAEHVAAVLSWQKQFRDGKMTMRNLQVQARPSMQSMILLERVCAVSRDKTGGALINALRKLKLQTYEGDTSADSMLQRILEAAAVPYMTRLCDWLEVGSLFDDPQKEFMVERKNTSTWESRYEIVPANVLQGFFSTQQAVERVLATGRYWNALQQSDNKGAASKPNSQPVAALTYASTTTAVSSYVQEKYNEASKALVRLLMEDYNLLGSLRLMKRYFLLEHGDFFMIFLDKAEEEMLKDLTHLSRNRVQHWMNSCLELLDPHSFGGEMPVANLENGNPSNSVSPTGLRCRFSTDGLTDHLDKLHAASGGIDTHEPWTPARHAYGGTVSTTRNKGAVTGLDTFFLDFASIPFPTSLVLSPNAIECYQLLFRHLFFAKHVERRLVSIWKDHQSMKEMSSLRGSMGPAFLLRQRMLHFVQNLIYYTMFEVIEPNWIEMESAIESPKSNKEQTIDDINQVHSLFLHRALEACLLTNRDLVRALTKLMKTCLLFSEQMKRFMKATKIDEDRNFVATEMQKMVQSTLNDRGGVRSSKLSSKILEQSLKRAQTERLKRVRRQTARVEREVSGESYQRMVTRFEEVFSGNLRDFMVQLTSSDDLFHTHKVNLCIRLDYNGYVTNSLGLI